MFRILAALLALTSSALAAPEFIEREDGETLLACATNLSEDQHQALWSMLMKGLETGGYKRITSAANDNGDFSDGTHTVFVSQHPEGVCIQYMSLDQPKYLVMHGEVAFEPIKFCHAKGIDFTFTWAEDVLLIDRFDDRAMCTRHEGDTFACVESKAKPDNENDYFVTADVIQKGKVLVFTPPNEPMQMISRCDTLEGE
jgi:hypothetical protein